MNPTRSRLAAAHAYMSPRTFMHFWSSYKTLGQLVLLNLITPEQARDAIAAATTDDRVNTAELARLTASISQDAEAANPSQFRILTALLELT